MGGPYFVTSSGVTEKFGDLSALLYAGMDRYVRMLYLDGLEYAVQDKPGGSRRILGEVRITKRENDRPDDAWAISPA